MTFIDRLWITPEGKVEPVQTLEQPSTPPEGPWYVRIESIDDVGVILINGMPVALDAGGLDTGWRDITTQLSTNCNSTIQMLAWNFDGPWSYKFSIMHGNTIVWAAEKSGSGSTGLFFDQEVIIRGDGELVW
ncbi:MAG: hypothetical protein HC884_10325 [Chloroflexaceae bacterium]|nr:hypothetical protein [Chloroflexaceae bacterium]